MVTSCTFRKTVKNGFGLDSGLIDQIGAVSPMRTALRVAKHSPSPASAQATTFCHSASAAERRPL